MGLEGSSMLVWLPRAEQDLSLHVGVPVEVRPWEGDDSAKGSADLAAWLCRPTAWWCGTARPPTSQAAGMTGAAWRRSTATSASGA